MKIILCITKNPLTLFTSVCGTGTLDANLSLVNYSALFTLQLSLLA